MTQKVKHSAAFIEVMTASDLMQGFVDHAFDQIADLSANEKVALIAEADAYKPSDAEEAAAIAVIKKIAAQKVH